MSSYEVRAIRFIHQIFPYFKDCKCCEDYQWAVMKFNRDCSRSVKFDHGQTRVAFMTSDYVVKLDYNPIGVQRWGGCEEEHKFYEYAFREGYAYLFAKIKPYYYRGIVFYIMPRVKGIGKYLYDADEYMADHEVSWCWNSGLRDLHNFNYGWKNGNIIIIDYGANQYRK